MILNLYEGLTWLREQETDDWIPLTEVRVDISPWTHEENGFGTSDNALLFPEQRRIVIHDWKYGMIPVSPERNDQMTLYFLGVWNDFGWKVFGNPEDITVELVISQPRAPGGGGIWRTTAEDLLLEGDRISKDAKRVHREPEKRIAGTKQCRYCAHAVNCEANARFTFNMVGMDFDDLSDFDPERFDPPSELTPEQRAAIILHFPNIKRWVDQLTGQAIQAYMADEYTAGLKVVTARKGNRKIRKNAQHQYERVLAQRLGNRAFKVDIISPAQAEDILGKEDYSQLIGDFIEQSDGKPQLVAEEDARERVSSAVSMFDEIL